MDSQISRFSLFNRGHFNFSQHQLSHMLTAKGTIYLTDIHPEPKVRQYIKHTQNLSSCEISWEMQVCNYLKVLGNK